MNAQAWMKLLRGVVLAFVLLAVGAPVWAANWDGDGGSSPAGTTYFNWSGRQNFYGDSEPTWNSSTALSFNYNNGGHSIMVQNIGYRTVQSIIYESTFTGSTTLQGSDGFDLYWKIENNDTGHHTVNVPIVVQGTALELNPISGNLTIGGGINNSNNRDLLVYGNNGNTLNHNNAVGSATVYLGEESGSDAATIDISTAGISVGNDITVRSGSSGIKTLDNASGGVITFGGNITLNATVNIDASTGESTIMNGAISGVGGLVRRGFGNVTLNGANTYSGGTFIDEGTLTIGSGGDIQNSSTIDIGSSIYNAGAGNAALALSAGAADLDRSITVQSGAGTRTLSSADNVTLSGNIDLNRNLTVSSSAGTLTIQGTVDLANSGNNDLLTSGNVTISGGITASTGASSIDHSSGTLTLSGNNSGSWFMLNIAGGAVALNNVNALGTAYDDKINFTGSGTLNVNANIAPAALGVRVSSGQTATINVGGGNTFTVAGALASVGGAGTFIQTGAGTVRLTGDSTYSGTYNLNQGTLTGDGEIRNFVQNGGVLSPGNSPGTWTIDGSATWNGGSYLWEINDLAGTQGNDPGWDFVDISGALNITAAYNINIDDLGALAGWNTLSSYSWRAITAVGGITGFGNLGLVTTAWNQNPYGGTFSLRQDGNDVWIDYTGGAIGPGGAVPEPNTIVYFGLAFVGLLALRSRKARVVQA